MSGQAISGTHSQSLPWTFPFPQLFGEQTHLQSSGDQTLGLPHAWTLQFSSLTQSQTDSSQCFPLGQVTTWGQPGVVVGFETHRQFNGSKVVPSLQSLLLKLHWHSQVSASGMKFFLHLVSGQASIQAQAKMSHFSPCAHSLMKSQPTQQLQYGAGRQNFPRPQACGSQYGGSVVAGDSLSAILKKKFSAIKI